MENQEKKQRMKYQGGHAPTGYRVSNGNLVIKEEEAKAVRRLFELSDSGLKNSRVAEALNREGYRTSHNRDFQNATVATILKNRRLYEGWRYDRETEEWIPDQQEAILKTAESE